tara:strand:- start:1185 stop:1343 length:159 start_codon:yes stop_codon:yes gene_type:complete
MVIKVDGKKFKEPHFFTLVHYKTKKLRYYIKDLSNSMTLECTEREYLELNRS